MLLDGDQSALIGSTGGGLHEQLLTSISRSDAVRFKELGEEIGQRRITTESDWCHDDYLLFLLLLGKEKFSYPLRFLTQVMEVRRKNANPVPRKVDEVFAALDRQEFGIDGEFGFLKIPFLYLVGRLRVGPAEA